MEAFKLWATLGIDTSEYDDGLDSAEEKGSAFGSALKTGGKLAVGALALTATAVVGTSKAFADGIADVAAYGDNIDKMSQKMGLSTDTYQEWDAVMQHCGTSIESMKNGMKTLANAAETGNESFEKIGITQEDIASMSQEELFAATIEGLQNVEDTTERTYLAGQLLGRGATELGALLNMTAEETQEMKDRVHELGGVMSEEAVKAAAAYTDSLQDLKTSFSGLKNNLLSQFLPSVTTVMDGLAEIMIGNKEGGLAMITDGVNEFVENLNTKIPEFMEVAANIVESLLLAITSNLPTLIASGRDVISNLISGVITALPDLLKAAFMLVQVIVDALLENLPQLMSVALELVVYLANGLTEYLPVLIPAVVSVVTQIITTLTQPDMLTLLIGAALQLILAIAQGLVIALPQLVAIIPEVVVNLVTALIESFPMIVDAVVVLLGDLGAIIYGMIGSLMGMNQEEIASALTNVWNLLTSAFSNLTNWLSNVVSTVSSWISGVVSTVTSFFSNLWNTYVSFRDTAVSAVVTMISNIVSFISSGLYNAYTTVFNILNTISGTFTSIFDNVKTTVENAINYVKGLFDFEWSLPDIKLPHFSIKGTLDLLATPPTYPTVSVSWYRKAMEQPYLLDGATIFGASGGQLLGGGEAGSEIVIGTNKLMSMMQEAVGLGGNPITINVYGAAGQDVRELAKEVSRELQNLVKDKEKAYA